MPARCEGNPRDPRRRACRPVLRACWLPPWSPGGCDTRCAADGSPWRRTPPGKHARKLDDLAAIFRIGMAVKVGALIDVALALGVDQNAERVVVLLELIADREIAIGRSVDVPRHRMGTGPMAVGPRADRHRHVEPGAHIESRTAHPRHFPPGAKVLCPHFRIGFG